MEELGKNIKSYRQSRSMTQKELADFLGYTESYISYIEKGERKISVDDLERIAKLFDVSIDALLAKPRVSHFRATTHDDDKTNYSKVMDDFLSHIDKDL